MFVGQSANYPGMVEGIVVLGAFSFGMGVLCCLPFYAFDTEGDLKGYYLRVFHPSTESTTDPINDKIKASEEKKFRSHSKGKFMWEE